MLDEIKIPVAAVGVNGSALGSGSTLIPIRGKVHSVFIDIGSQPNTVDVTLKTKGNNSYASQQILAASNMAASGWYYPRAATQDTSGAPLLYAAAGTAQSAMILVDDFLQVDVAQGNAGAVVVTVFLEP